MAAQLAASLFCSASSRGAAACLQLHASLRWRAGAKVRRRHLRLRRRDLQVPFAVFPPAPARAPASCLLAVAMACCDISWRLIVASSSYLQGSVFGHRRGH